MSSSQKENEGWDGSSYLSGNDELKLKRSIRVAAIRSSGNGSFEWQRKRKVGKRLCARKQTRNVSPLF